ncbi:hypothetical protein FB451DRAFT_1287469 [Mycena latifolia]|nr:hypothetical protein FB451DRAFT_1287469 [Mycena latifolia]
MSSPSLAHSSPLLCRSHRKQVTVKSSASCRTSRSREHPQTTTSQLTPSGDCRPTRKVPSEMSPKRTEPSGSPHPNGPVLSFAFGAKTASPLTHQTVLVFVPVPEFTEYSPMRVPISCALQTLVHYLNGLTIMFSFALSVATLQLIMSGVNHGMLVLSQMGAGTTMEGAYGTKGAQCQMVGTKKWMKTPAQSCATSPYSVAPGLPATQTMHIAWRILIVFLPFSESLGRCTRTFRLVLRSLISASYGICTPGPCPLPLRKKLNTLTRSRSGTPALPTLLARSKDCTENYSTPAWQSLQGDLTSPTWRPCSRSSTTVLSCQGLPPAALQAIFSGGRTSSSDLSWGDPSPDRASLLISARSRTLARASVSRLSSGITGGPGGSYQVGTETGGTSGGPRPLVSNSSFGPFSVHARRAPISRSMETIKVSSRGGGTRAVETSQQMVSSAAYTSSVTRRRAPSTPAMLLAPSTQPTILLGGSTLPVDSYSPPSSFPTNSAHSSSITMPHSPTESSNHGRRAMHRNLNRNRSVPYPAPTSPSSPRLSGKAFNSSLTPRAGSTNPDRWNAALPSKHMQGLPTRYPANLTPLHSPQRPHVLAGDRLRLWIPWHARNTLDGNGQPVNVSPDDLERIKDVMQEAWGEGTRDTYGSGLLVWHVFHDKRGTPEPQRAPTSPVLLAAFIASIAGAYSGKTVSNYVYGVRAWHILHGAPWSVNPPELEALLNGANRLTPASSRRKKRLPYTVVLIIEIHRHLDLTLPLHAAVWSCLTCTFWAAGRVGEFTIKTLTAFDPAKHVKPSDVTETVDRSGREMTEIGLPTTKSAPQGEQVSWAKQDGLSDPKAALNNHMAVNDPPPDGPLFAYKDGKKAKHKPLTKSKFLKVLAAAIKQAGHEPMQGHGIQIGATLEYLLRGVPFDVMKTKGRWASNAFEVYLTKHAQILAPYMQARPEIHDNFVRYTMPRIR